MEGLKIQMQIKLAKLNFCEKIKEQVIFEARITPLILLILLKKNYMVNEKNENLKSRLK
jgi:hypothetical protein